jgi:hypothetical protein
MFIEIKTDMYLKKIVQTENIRKWIKDAYVNSIEECEDELLKCLNLSSEFAFKDASLVNKDVFRIISITKSFTRVSFSFHERNTIESKIKTLLTPKLTKS